LFCLRYSQAALRIQCLRLQACYFDFDTERYTVGLGGCFADHLAEILRNDLEQLRQVAHRVRTPLVCVDLLATRRESLA
jgi:hypothetical protein